MVGGEDRLKRDGETIDEFFQGRLKILQKERGYRFSVDALLLADFATLQRGNRLVDLGAGSGIISLILALRFPETSITEVEIQEDLAEERRAEQYGRSDQGLHR